MNQGTLPDELPDELATLWYLIRRVAGLMDRQGEALFRRELGISLAQFLVLSVVDASRRQVHHRVPESTAKAAPAADKKCLQCAARWRSVPMLLWMMSIPFEGIFGSEDSGQTNDGPLVLRGRALIRSHALESW